MMALLQLATHGRKPDRAHSCHDG